jgi:hypothetical protein
LTDPRSMPISALNKLIVYDQRLYSMNTPRSQDTAARRNIKIDVAQLLLILPARGGAALRDFQPHQALAI